ncbi:MAG: LysR family transcriptional regulator [Clostridia bacterium]|nr:LysR family transcriptional regulator [Clostridia bacterium]
MNQRQMHYALTVARCRSFSQAAEELEVSQPALSKQIISLEQELGVRLFDRATTPVTLTPAGEVFIRRAGRLLSEEDELVRAMERFRTGESGRLTIGIAPSRSPYLTPPLLLALRAQFPGLQFVLCESNSTQLHKGILEGQYDFAIMNLPVDESQLEAIPLEKDTLVLAVPRAMLPLIGRDEAAQEAIPLEACGALPFIALSQGQELRRLFDKLCTLSGAQITIGAEVVSISTAWALVQAGVGAAVLPRQMIDAEGSAEAVLFPLEQSTYTRQPAIITRRGQERSAYAAAAIELLTGRGVENRA